MAAAGPSRLKSNLPPPAPSTSGDSESTVPVPTDKGLDVGILRELAKSALVESLNDVGNPLYCRIRLIFVRYKAQKHSFWRQHWQDRSDW